jgi:hypothetical protein
MDSLEKQASPPLNTKEEKKKKEKKPGMLGGLFKRKDKKSKNKEEESVESIMGRDSNSAEPRESRDTQNSKNSDDTASIDKPVQQVARTQSQTLKANGKLQKTNPSQGDVSPIMGPSREAPKPVSAPVQQIAPAAAVVAPTMRAVEPELTRDQSPSPVEEITPKQQVQQAEDTLAPAIVDEKKTSPVSSIFQRARASSNAHKPEKLKKVKVRQELDDFDSSPEPAEHSRNPFEDQEEEEPTTVAATPPPSRKAPVPSERLSESPEHIDYPSSNNPPALVVDTSSQEEERSSPISPSSSPEMDHRATGTKVQDTPDSTAESSTIANTWNDAHLRHYMDHDTGVREMLIIVNDTNEVAPPAADHPFLSTYLKDEREAVAKLSSVSPINFSIAYHFEFVHDPYYMVGKGLWKRIPCLS